MDSHSLPQNTRQQKRDYAKQKRELAPEGTAYCSRCDQYKDKSEFPVRKRFKSGLYPYCKPCASAYGKEYHSTPEHKDRDRERRLTPEYQAVEQARYNSPEYKARKSAYNTSPERRAKMKVYRETYKLTPEQIVKKQKRLKSPEHKAKMAAYNAKPERKARVIELRSRPEYKAKQAAWNARYRLNPENRKKEAIRKSSPEYKEKAFSHRSSEYAKAKRLSYRRKLSYGITQEAYDALLAQQNGVCAICGNPETVIIRGTLCPLSVDHDHDTGKIRGLLCSTCNAALGLFKDNIENLSNAIDYLMGFNR